MRHDASSRQQQTGRIQPHKPPPHLSDVGDVGDVGDVSDLSGKSAMSAMWAT